MRRYQTLTPAKIARLKSGDRLYEDGIVIEKTDRGDLRYLINIQLEGKRISRTVGYASQGTTLETCEALIGRLRLDSREGKLQVARIVIHPRPFDASAHEYLDRLTRENGKDLRMKRNHILYHLIPFFKSKELKDISGSDISIYQRERLSAGAKPASINRELAVLSHLMSMAVEWGWIEVKLKVRLLREDNVRKIYLTAEQVKRLLVTAKADDNQQVYLFTRIALATSMRKSEILSIAVNDIDLDNHIIFVPIAKAGSREQPFPPTLKGILVKHMSNGSPWLFPSTGRKAKSSSGHTINIDKAFRRVVAEAGLDPMKVTRHTLRHTAITHMVQAGVDLPTVQRISGHKTLEMVVRYSHQSGAHIQSALAKLSDRLHAESDDE